MIGHTMELFELQDVIYRQELELSMISVSKLTEKGYSVTFDKIGCKVINKKNETVISVKLENGLYVLENKIIINTEK